MEKLLTILVWTFGHKNTDPTQIKQKGEFIYSHNRNDQNTSFKHSWIYAYNKNTVSINSVSFSLSFPRFPPLHDGT